MEKVWLINYTGKKGGGPVDSYEMARGLLHNGIKTVAIVSSEIENLEAWKELDLLELIIIETYKGITDLAVNTILFKIKQRRVIENTLKKYKVEVIYCPMITFWTKMINHIWKESQVIEVVHDPIFHPGESVIIRAMYRNAISSADKLIVHSKSFIDITKKKYRKKTYYIPLGRHSVYSECKNKKKLLEYDSTKINFLFFGTFSEYKGLNILAEAYKKLCEKYEDGFTLTLIGSGDFAPYREAYKNLCHVNIINRWIKDEEVDSIFHGKNLVCVCPYIEATQSGAVMLALEYAIPIIATNTGGMSEQIIAGKTGILVKAGDVDELRDAMEKLLLEKKIRDDISKNQKKVINKYSWDRLAEKLILISKR